MRRVERLAEEIAAERYRNVRALFLRQGARPPFLLWRPREHDLPARPLVDLLQWWSGLPCLHGLPNELPPDPQVPASVQDYLIVADPCEDRYDFVYRQYGAGLIRAFGQDMRGARVSAFGGHVAVFTAAVYRAVLLRGEPIYTSHQPASDLVSQSDRVVLPMAGPDGSVAQLVIANVPEAPYRMLLDMVMDGVLMFDRSGSIRMANGTVAAMLGCSEASLQGKPMTEVLRAPFIADGLAAGDGPITVAREALARRADGSEFAVEVSVGEARRGPRPLFVAVVRDVSVRKAAEAHYRALAFTDPLTGLANRVLFRDRLGQALARARRARAGLALLMIDLDGFKSVNDRFGHGGGDQALQEFAHRLQSEIREADILARLGGDEFALVQTDLEQPAGVQALADRLVVALAEPFRLGGGSVSLAASIGVAVYPSDGEDALVLAEHADRALYQAKARGGACWLRFGRVDR